jgi:hypothetical protein
MSSSHPQDFKPRFTVTMRPAHTHAGILSGTIVLHWIPTLAESWHESNLWVELSSSTGCKVNAASG